MSTDTETKRLYPDGPTLDELTEPGSPWRIADELVEHYRQALGDGPTRAHYAQAESELEWGGGITHRDLARAAAGLEPIIGEYEQHALGRTGIRDDKLRANPDAGWPTPRPDTLAYGLHLNYLRAAQELATRARVQARQDAAKTYCPVCQANTLAGGLCHACQQVRDLIELETVAADKLGRHTRREAVSRWMNKR